MRRRILIKTKTVQIELRFYGDGRVIQMKPGHFVGGLPDPKLGKSISFTVHRQIADEDGLMNPIADERAVEGSFQINVSGNSKGYKELGRYLLALAELDTAEDDHDHLVSKDGRTHLHVILRKRDKLPRSSKRGITLRAPEPREFVSYDAVLFLALVLNQRAAR